MIEQEAKVVFNKQVAHDTFLMGLESPEMIAEARPGQFVMIRIRQGIDPLLRRPFSISGAKGDEIVLVLYRIVGRGTAILSEVRKGEALSTLGPLGKGFDPGKRDGKSILAAGGMGVAPLISLAQALEGTNLTLMAGYRSAMHVIPMGEFGLDSMKLIVTTDDGTAGHHGLVSEILENHLAASPEGSPAIFACGPLAMLKRVATLTIERNLPCQVSLEVTMACGVGACQGCAVRASSQENRSYHNVCKDGPVFGVQSLDWENL